MWCWDSNPRHHEHESPPINRAPYLRILALIIIFSDPVAGIGLFQMGHHRPLFHLFRLFKQTLQFYNLKMWKVSIQYMVLGFEPMAFRTWLTSHNHKTRAPARDIGVTKKAIVLHSMHQLNVLFIVGRWSAQSLTRTAFRRSCTTSTRNTSLSSRSIS